MDIQKLAQEQFDYMVKHRRHLHTHPEMSGKEFETVLYIINELKALDIPYIEVENGGERSEQEIQLVDDGESHAIHVYAGLPTSWTLTEGVAPPTTVV